MNEIDLHNKKVIFCFECVHFDSEEHACELNDRLKCKYDYCSDAEPKESPHE